MKSKIINSENPYEHWNDFENVNGKIVLDLGCGWLFQPFVNTPQYFIENGCEKVIGVDASCGETEKLKELFPLHTFICSTINSHEHLESLFTLYQPQIVKMDIEGAESHLQNVSIESISSIQQFGIEYHNPQCKSIVENFFTRSGFEVQSLNQFGWYVTDTNIMGVMHAKRII